MAGTFRVTQVKSSISHIARNRATLKALGLHGIGSSVDVADNEATRGMVRQVRFLVSVDESAKVGGSAQPRDDDRDDDHADASANARARRSSDAEESSK